MSFKEQAIADISTFTNVNEFGDTIAINGAPMACVLVNDEAPTDDEGVSLLESTLYVRASDLALPAVRERMRVGDRLANVVRVEQEAGMLAIHLRWFES